MFTLILDCAFKPVVSLLKDGKELLIKTSENEKHSDSYMLLIDTSLRELNISIADIDEIMLNVGPGSFTGLRVALSIVKGLGYGDDKKILTFSSFDYLKEKKYILVEGFSNFVYQKNDKNSIDEIMFIDNPYLKLNEAHLIRATSNC